MDLAKDGAEDGETSEERRGDYGVAADADVEGSCFWECLSVMRPNSWREISEKREIPSRASSKQCRGSQWLVKMTTLWPRF